MEHPNNLRKLREKKGISLKKLTDDTGINYNTYVKLERNERTISEVNADILAKYLDCAVSDIHKVPRAFRTVPVTTVSQLAAAILGDTEISTKQEIRVETQVARPAATQTKCHIQFDDCIIKGRAIVVIDRDNRGDAGDTVLALMPSGDAAVATLKTKTDMVSLGKVIHIIKDFETK